MKHYCAHDGPPKTRMRPWLVFDVRFDIRDVRSSTSETLERNFQAEMIPMDDDLIWTPDMVVEHSPSFLVKNAKPIAPPQGFDPESIHDRAESKFLEYLLRHHRIVIQRNTSYDLYAGASEPREEFLSRCRERALQEMAQEMQAVSDRYLRRLLQVEDGAKRALQELQADGDVPSPQQLEMTTVFLKLRDEISAIGLQVGLTGRESQPLSFEAIPDALGSREKLKTLRKELQRDVAQVTQTYRQRVDAIEPFPLSLTLHQIDIVGTAILWQS